jgi:hypothetical protein
VAWRSTEPGYSQRRDGAGLRSGAWSLDVTPAFFWLAPSPASLMLQGSRVLRSLPQHDVGEAFVGAAFPHDEVASHFFDALCVVPITGNPSVSRIVPA